MKIKRSIKTIDNILKSPKIKNRLPLIKWYTMLLYPVQRLFLDSFEKNRFKLRVLKERCTNCLECIGLCERGCWKPGPTVPVHSAENCDLCLGCVHHCTGKAIIFSMSMKDNPRLNELFYKTVDIEYFGWHYHFSRAVFWRASFTLPFRPVCPLQP
jgi:NAD-dependent dihydropyrimidine dehydrogenase PreA subunit